VTAGVDVFSRTGPNEQLVAPMPPLPLQLAAMSANRSAKRAPWGIDDGVRYRLATVPLSMLRSRQV
jgi:hypothetical protein